MFKRGLYSSRVIVSVILVFILVGSISFAQKVPFPEELLWIQAWI